MAPHHPPTYATVSNPQINASLASNRAGTDEDREVARLEAQNAGLRIEARALLEHQALLEGLVQEGRAAEEEARKVVEESERVLARKAKLS